MSGTDSDFHPRADPKGRETATHAHPATTRTLKRLTGGRRRVWHFVRFLGRRLFNSAAILVPLCVITLVTLTLVVFSGFWETVSEPMWLYSIVVIDVLLLLALGSFLVWRFIRVFRALMLRRAGSRTHLRLATILTLLAAIPAGFSVILSLVFINFVLDSWFSGPVRTAIEESVSISEAWINDSRKEVTSDALRIALDLNRLSVLLENDPERFTYALSVQVQTRGISEALVINSKGNILARAGLTFAMELEGLPIVALQEAKSGNVLLLTGEQENRVRAILRLDNFEDAFLFIGRVIDPNALRRVERVQNAANQYQEIAFRRESLENSAVVALGLICSMLIFLAFWYGLRFSDRIVQPVRDLVGMTERVGAGDYSAHAPVRGNKDELDRLCIAFNAMTDAIRNQQEGLLAATRVQEERLRFEQTVFNGISAGIIVTDDEDCILQINGAGQVMLGVHAADASGRSLLEIAPGFAPLMRELRNRKDSKGEDMERDLELGDQKTLHVRAVINRSYEALGENRAWFALVTLDDLSQLVAAERRAAWADIARRMAHEIRNPLTPIQLSAERLHRKFLPSIQQDEEVFSDCLDTIVRKVGEIDKQVREFSDFARVPALAPESESIEEIVRLSMFLQKNASTDIDYELDMAENMPRVRCDRRQVDQALTNLLQNAVRAIHHENEKSGKIRVEVLRQSASELMASGLVKHRKPIHGNGNGGGDQDGIAIVVTDNGQGLPKEGQDGIVKPYVSTWPEGTGLGLSIVRNIMQDHEGRLTLADSPGRGAVASLWFPIDGPGN